MRGLIPALMRTYPGFKPWDADRYSKGELDGLIDGLPEIERATWQESANSE